VLPDGVDMRPSIDPARSPKERLGGAAARATLVAGGASTPAADEAPQGTFVAAMRAALIASGVLAATGAVLSLSGSHVRPLGFDRIRR
jgi:hypothetical protein